MLTHSTTPSLIGPVKHSISSLRSSKMDNIHGTTSTDVPYAPEAWKRAVYRAAPSHFCVEVLSAAKHGGSLYGMRICPIRSTEASCGDSVDSKSSNSEYIIWRKWEDCLWFQENMEMEYRRLAREKRVRLAAGKGVKKNGLYLHDRAASFESLPPGPDPRSVARDIHQILPKLTKRGTFFKPSQATIDQRINELQALVDALFAEDVPTLVKDLTSDRTIIDFFGYWRRDHDLDAKSKGKETKPPSSKPRYSISSSVFSMYFNSSSHSTSQLPSPQSSMAEFPTDPPLPQRRLREPEDLPRPVSTTTIASSNVSSAHGCGESDIPVRPPMPNLVSSNSSPAPSTLGSKESLAVPSPIIVTEEFPIILDHSGDYVLDHQTHDRPWITLEALPEGHELKTGVPFPLEGGDEVTFPGKLSKRVVPEGHLLRNAKAFRPPPHSPPYTPPQSPLSKVHNPALPDADRSFETSKSSRLSWQSSLSTVSSDSSAAYLHDLNLALPPSPTEPAHNTRSSISSVASNMTNCSADAIIPRSLTQPTSPRTLPSRSRDRRRPASIPEEEAWPEAGEGSGKDGRVTLPRKASSRPTTPVTDRRFHSPARSVSPVPTRIVSSTPLRSPTESQAARSAQQPRPLVIPSRSRPPRSPRRPATAECSTPASATSELTSPGSPIDGPSITVKAAFNNSIVVFRTPRDISFQDVRKRLQEKFGQQQGLPLSNTFTIAYVLPETIVQADDVDPGRARTRATSLSTAGIPDLKKVRFVTSQVEWKLVVNCSAMGKLTLRIIDTIA